MCLLLILSNKLDLNQETRFTIKAFEGSSEMIKRCLQETVEEEEWFIEELWGKFK